MNMANDGFLLFMCVILVVILVSIQFTLNRILKVLNELKSRKG